ncbi:MAG: aminotransferase class I/II-fold pyridoxal phosphate-dependent enzyme [Actinobacteria bacterium]|nr:aminotransferase class I/II-fold pyridoxal phosphate-dependent enzyme [Actinomycetota bacterium]
MSNSLAIRGGTPVIDRPAPHVPWPPIDASTAATVASQLCRAVSIPDRSGVIAELEDRLADYFGVRQAVLTSSGTAALHSAYAALGLTDGDEVIVPAYTFHATATPLFHLRVKPVLVDCDELGNLDPAAVERAIGPATKAVAVTHLWGVPGQVELLTTIARDYGLTLIEDGSHAHGATVKGRKIGSFGHIAAFSMNGPKPLSAGEGGFTLTDNDEAYYQMLLHGHYNKRCRGEIPMTHPLQRYAVTGTGLKLRIHPLAAALALNQLDALDERLEGRREIAARMITALRELPGIVVPRVPPECKPSWYALGLVYQPDELHGLPVDAIVEALQAEGCLELDRPGSTRPLNEHPLFSAPDRLFPSLPQGWPRYRPGQFPHAERLHRNTLKLTVPHDDVSLADAYVEAFEKVLSNPHELRKDASV